ncbi:MAG: tetratricopeptide repeat protein, partial [Myxococcota bacterium]
RCLAPEPSPGAREPGAIYDEALQLAASLALGDGIARLDEATKLDGRARASENPRVEALTALQLGAAQLQSGRLGEATTSLQRAYFLAGQHELHDRAAEAAFFLASAYSQRGTPREALDWIAHAAMMVVRGDLDARTRVRIEARGADLAAQHEGPEAGLRLLDAAVAIARAELGEADRDTAQLAVQRGRYLLAAGRAEEAATAYTDALVQLHLALGQDDPQVAEASVEAAGVDVAGGRFDVAHAKIEASVDTLRGTLGPRHLATTTAMAALAEVLSRVGSHDDAVRLLDNVVAIRRQTLGDEHPRVADAELELARALLAQGDPGKATEAAMRSEKIYEEVVAPAHPALSAARAVISEASARVGEPQATPASPTPD